MTTKTRQTIELEAELKRLNALVRERREFLASLVTCPNSDCPCRVEWKDRADKGLARQMRKIGKQVSNGCDCDAHAPAPTPAKAKKSPAKKSPAKA